MYKNYFACKCGINSRRLSKLLLSMKLITILMLVCIFQVRANTYAQKINLNVRNAPLKTVFQMLTDQTDYEFIYNSDILQNTKPISISAKNEQFLDVLKKCFNDQPIDYLIKDNTIVITKIDKPSIEKSPIQDIVTGTVTAADDGLPMPSVTVKVLNTNRAIATDKDGNFKIEATIGQTLQFSFIGYTSQDFVIKDNNAIKISLKPAENALSEVSVVGYGTQKKRDVTGSVVTIKTKDLPQVANVSINNLLQGRAAGLNLSQRSAQPGGGLSINIRGGTAPPLYVIDGVPLFNNRAPEPGIEVKDIGFSGGIDRDPLSSINPSDIESIDVLKDASAAAIYGSAAANGVVLITTKKGKAGKVETDYRGSFTSQSPKKYFQLLNAKEFMQQQVRLAKDKFLYDNNLAPYGNSTATPVFSPLFTPAQIESAGAGTDWLDLVLRNGNINEHNISVSSGAAKTKIYTSFNYYNNKAIIENSDFKRYTGRLNLEQELSERVKFSVNTTFSQINSNNASTGQNDGDGVEKYNGLQAAYAYVPTLGIYDQAGEFSTSLNRLITNPAAFFIITNTTKTNRFFAAPNLEVKVLDNLKVNLVGGIDRQSSSLTYFLPRKARNAQLPEGMAQLSTNHLGNYSAEGYATYNKSFEDHTLSIVGGAGYYQTNADNFGLQAVGFFTDALGADNVGLASNKDKSFQNSSRSQTVKLSQFLRVNYAYNSKYMLSFNARRDGSSNFAANHKWGIFPGVSAGWQISQEPFLSSSKILSNLKLRVGYGEVGNDANLNALTLYGLGGGSFLIGNTLYPSVALTQLGNDDLTWETNKSINIGLDYGLLNDRLTGAIEVFRRDATDFIRYVPLPYNNTVSRLQTNLGGDTRSEGIEFSINSKNTTGSVRWETSFNISKYRNKWLKRSPYDVLNSYQKKDDRLDVVYGWQTDGIIQNAASKPTYMPNARLGNVRYVDQNGDGKLDVNDVVELGNRNPDWILGLGNTISFKNFDLNVFVYGRINQYMSNNYAGFYSTDRIARLDAQNTLVGIKNVWSVDNPTGSLPGVAANPYAGANPTGNSDFYQEYVSYLRVRNVSLGYTFNKMKAVQSVRLFLDFQNLGTITNYKGYDPELSEANPYPQTLSTTFGINVKF
jgi:TonB-linked SusC/RagA family outer membrane protein